MEVYSHACYENGFSVGGSKEGKNLSAWIGKLGGKMRLVVDEDVDLAVVETHTLLRIMDNFLLWRQNLLQPKLEPSPGQPQAKTKRELMLLGI